MRWRLHIFLLLGAVIAACHSERPTDGITVLLDSPPDNLDDRRALTANGQRVAQLITPGLVTFDDAGALIPDLAESFRQVDSTTYEFRLREGLVFHDGSSLTSEDVKATFEGIMRPGAAWPKASKLKPIRSIELLDVRTLRFHLKQPYAPFLAELTMGIVPKARAFSDEKSQEQHPIGAGPFRFESHPDEDQLSLVRFERYYGGSPAIPRLEFRVVRDETTRVLEMLKGRADLLLNAVSPAVLPVLQKESRLHVLTKPSSTFTYIGLNLRRGALADVRVREAICSLIDIPPILQYKFHGLAMAATGMLPPNHWAYAKTPGCAYDPHRAAALLDEAGFRAPDGSGKESRLTLTLKTSTDRFRKSIALILKEQLARGGIALEIRSLEWGTFLRDVNQGNFDLFMLKQVGVIEPDILRWAFSSQSISPEATYGGLNRVGFRNSEVDSLLEQALQSSLEQRQEFYARVLNILRRDLPVLPLWHEDTVAVVSSRLKNFKPSTQGFFTPLAYARMASP